jgi:DNA-binding NarL/FixJ family response regulator
MTAEPIRVLLVDDHATVRESLAWLLGRHEDIAVVCQAESVDEARGLIENGIEVDVAIVDLMLEDGDGVALLPRLRQRNPEAKVVILTGVSDRREHGRALLQGASAIMSKVGSADALVACVRDLHAGVPVMTPQAVMDLVRAYDQAREEESLRARQIAGLSARERAVLQALAEGLSDQEIAERLFVEVSTVHTHVHNILRKLGAHSRLQAAIIAIRAGMGDPA